MTPFQPVVAPAPDRLAGHLRVFSENQITYAKQIAQHGDYVKMRLGNLWMYFLNHPDLAHELMVTKSGSFHKARNLKAAFRDVSGENIFSSDGEFWKRQHKLMQPAFHSKRIGAYVDTMTDYTLREMESWRDGAEIDIDAAMTELTMRIITKTMFNTEMLDDPDEIGRIVGEMFTIAGRRLTRAVIWPSWVPTRENREMRRFANRLNALHQQTMDGWRKSGEDKGDLLSMIMLARYDDGSPMSDQQIKHELSTVFGAGHETTANTLSFAWYALSQNPDVEARLHEELDSVLAGRNITLADLANLPYTEMVIKETMRLYPVAQGVLRNAIEDVEIGGHIIPKGGIAFAPLWVIHHDERWFPDPMKFDPERFSPEREKTIPRGAYFPFGGGRRVCIGSQFAMMEARVLLATIAQHKKLSLKPGYVFRPAPHFTVRAEDGLPMIAHSRQPVP